MAAVSRFHSEQHRDGPLPFERLARNLGPPGASFTAAWEKRQQDGDNRHFRLRELLVHLLGHARDGELEARPRCAERDSAPGLDGAAKSSTLTGGAAMATHFRALFVHGRVEVFRRTAIATKQYVL
jgi:hypothetical protein